MRLDYSLKNVRDCELFGETLSVDIVLKSVLDGFARLFVADVDNVS